MLVWFSTTGFYGKGSNVKKYIVALLMGAFLCVSLTATMGCTETKETKKTETKETKETKTSS